MATPIYQVNVPDHITSDKDPDFSVRVMRKLPGKVGVKTLIIEPHSPWGNGNLECFNGKLRDELLNHESFETLLEARVLIEQWRQRYNTACLHSASAYRPSAPETMVAVLPFTLLWASL